MLSPQQWHIRFQQQAGWTSTIRQHLFERIRLKQGARVLESGCGTGAITAELAHNTHFTVFGLDIDMQYLRVANREDALTRYLHADALSAPFDDATFDAAICHMFLLWIADPLLAIAEMVRCTRPGGWVLALAEPDYGGRIDYPPQLGQLGRIQASALRQQGAQPERGRELAALFSHAGLDRVEAGVLGGQWRSAEAMSGFEEEWQVLASDLAGSLPPEEMRRLNDIDRSARQSGQRILFVPTFYAFGQVS